METIAILKNPRLSVDDRDLVALRFDAALEGVSALQMIYLEGARATTRRFTELVRAAGNFDRLDGLPIIVDKEPGSMVYKRPANI